MNDILIDSAVRKIPDFPKKGILFYDITGLLINPEAFHYCLDKLTSFYKDEKIDAVAAIESRGFIFAAPFADRLGIPLILIRKKGKLPGEILLLDDLIATGGTLNAARKMLNQGGAEVVGFCGVIGLPFLHYDKIIGDLPIKTLIEYDSE